MFSTHVVPRKFNKSIGYKISFSDGENLNLDKAGHFVSSGFGFTDIKIPIEPLPVAYVDVQANVKHQDGLSVLFFRSNPNAMPLVIDENIEFHRFGFVHAFLRTWYYQNLNSEEYKLSVILPIHISSKLKASSKVWLYNNYFLIHKLQRQNINTLFERIDAHLFKLKSLPTFNLAIDTGGGSTVFEEPIIITSFASTTGDVLEFFTTLMFNPAALTSTRIMH